MGTKLSIAERQAQIVEMLSQNSSLKAVELAEHFQVSRETIRRDLMALNKSGTMKKWSVGTDQVNDFKISSFDSRLSKNYDIKLRICQKALQYIPAHAVLFLDTGSTMVCMAQLLRDHAGYTILTNSIPVVNTLLESDNQIILAGGNVNHKIMSCVGMQCVSFLERFKVDVAIFGTSGFDRHKGPTCNNLDDCQIKSIIIDNAQTNIVLADSEKATRSALTQFAAWREIDYLIADDALPAEKAAELQDKTTLVLV